LAAALAGCGQIVPPPPAAPPPPPALELPPATASPAESPPPPDPPPPPAPPVQRPPFPPPAFPVPFERTAATEDGVWRPLVPGVDGEASLFYRATVHPDPVQHFLAVAVVAIDLDRIAVHLVAGTREPLSTTVPPERRPGLVPAADLPSLVAVMNGGFMTRHGSWGLMIGGDVFLPPHDDGCTVALYADDRVRVRTHVELADTVPAMIAYRQTPPCLVEQGAVSPALLGDEKPRRWGLSATGGVTIQRSAIGVAEGARTLLYGFGEGIPPRALAEAMRAAGAVDAAELDVNWSFPRFLVYGPGASPQAPRGSTMGLRPAEPGSAPYPEVTATLVPRVEHAPGAYVVKPAERDFFYLTRRGSGLTSSGR
jgi:Phosphodiester glycosidase